MRYRYVKKLPRKKNTFLNLFTSKLLPGSLVILGLFLASSAIFPIVFYEVFYSPQLKPLVVPIAEEGDDTSEVLGEKTNLDLTRPANWFYQAPHFPPRPSRITHYSLSIPKLGIKDAVVQIGGEDLKKILVQYEGTAYPGQFGNTVIFGHSVLPQFFNPKNYLTIFSTLPTLEKDDEILIDFDGVLYKYLVEDLAEVAPSDISVLEQRYDDYHLTLVTCVPPGTYLRRLAVRGRLTKL